ncbi:MAG: FG-GAP-like repeat-containing protein [Phycisphaerales bacterium]
MTSTLACTGCNVSLYGYIFQPPALPGSKLVADDFKDAAFADYGFGRRVAACAQDGQVLSVVYDENDPAHPVIATAALPGVTVERMYIQEITPGSADLVIKTTTGILFLEGSPDGTFSGPPRTIFAGQLDAVDGNAVAFVDANKDGHLDIVAAGSRSDTQPPNSVEARLLINDGVGNFMNQHTLQQPPHVITVTWVEGGVYDNPLPTVAIAIATEEPRLLTTDGTTLKYLSTSTGQPQNLPTEPLEGSGGVLLLADLNNDDRTDLISTRPTGGIAVRLAEPTGGLGPTQNYGGAIFRRLVCDDFNADGLPDVAAHAPAPGALCVYPGIGGGMLGTPQIADASSNALRLEFAPATPGSAFPAAFLTVDPVTNTVQTYAMGPTGPVSTDRRAYTRDGDPVSTKDAAVADVNGDGFPDLIASESAVSEFNFALNAADGSGQFLPNNHDRLLLLNRIAPMRPVEGQGDGRAAVAVTLNGSTTAAVMRLNSTTNPTDWVPVSVLGLPEPGVDVAVGDFDGDGRDDAIFSHAGNNRAFTLAKQQPGGSFSVGASFSVAGGAWNRVAAGDLDGDGRPEVIVFDKGTGSVRSFANDGTGSFTSAPAGALSLPPPLSSDVAFGDVDGDGNADAIFGAGPASLANGSVRVARGNGAGGFIDTRSTPLAGPAESLARGDVDGDGIDDVVAVIPSGSPLADGSLALIRGTPTGLAATASYHYIRGDPKGVFIVDLKNPGASSMLRTAASRPSVLVASYSTMSPYEGISVLEPVIAPSCSADLNGDDLVEDGDFVIFLGAYNFLDCQDAAMPAGCPADLNRDGAVDDADFTIFVAAYNELVCP